LAQRIFIKLTRNQQSEISDQKSEIGGSRSAIVLRQGFLITDF
jgi:hypothetical protein